MAQIQQMHRPVPVAGMSHMRTLPRVAAALPRQRLAGVARVAPVPKRAALHVARVASGEKFEEENKQYAALTQQIEEAAAEAVEGLQGTSIFLVGMMGSGKSTVGKLVSQALGYCFFDTDGLIEQLAGKSIPEIFAEDGEEDFRAIETQVLQELSPFKNCIISTGGGAPIRSQNWGHMSAGVSVWLNGPPALLARRLAREGTENRPLLNQTGAEESGTSGKGREVVVDFDTAYQQTLGRLTQLLEERQGKYAQSDIMVSLEGEDPATADFGAPVAAVALRVLSAINDRIQRDAATREERKNFKVVNTDLPPTMQVIESINPAVGTTGDADPYLP